MILNRRKFFKWLGVGTAAAVVAPTMLKALEPLCVAPKTLTYTTYVMGKDAIISEYANYVNFSDFALASAMDEAVENAAAELGHRAGLSVAKLHKSTFDSNPRSFGFRF
jgi:hypothetical protein